MTDVAAALDPQRQILPSGRLAELCRRGWMSEDRDGADEDSEKDDSYIKASAVQKLTEEESGFEVADARDRKGAVLSDMESCLSNVLLFFILAAKTAPNLTVWYVLIPV
jgi:hypothetical protein